MIVFHLFSARERSKRSSPRPHPAPEQGTRTEFMPSSILSFFQSIKSQWGLKKQSNGEALVPAGIAMGEPSSSIPSRDDPTTQPSTGGFNAMYVDDEENDICVGTFDTEEAAWQASLRAVFKIFGTVSFPSHWQPTAMERTFQEILTKDEVVSIIHNDSYDSELEKFSSSNPVELFRKKLAASDVEGSRGLYLRASDAMTHFGTDPSPALEFLDWQKKSWVFEYRVKPKRKNQNEYYLGSGWRAFAEEKNIQMEDYIVFFRCEKKDSEGKVVPYFMIATVKPGK